MKIPDTQRRYRDSVCASKKMAMCTNVYPRANVWYLHSRVGWHGDGAGIGQTYPCLLLNCNHPSTMRLPLQPMPLSGGASLKPVAVKRSYLGAKPHQRNDAQVPGEPADSFDDENEENQSELANMLDEILDDEKGMEESKGENNVQSESPEAKENLSLVERRAALFGDVANTKRRWSKPVEVKAAADNIITGNENNTNGSKGVAEEEEVDGEIDKTQQQPEEYKSTSPKYNEEFPTPMSSPPNCQREEQTVSPSHMDFESKKRAIFNFANKSTSCDQKWPKGGKSHFGKSIVDEACDEADVREAAAEEALVEEDACDPDQEDHTGKNQAQTCKDEASSKSSTYIDLSELEQSIKDAEKFLSPLPGNTTKAVYSPSPHLLKPSQMNLKTYSDELFRRQSDLKEPEDEDHDENYAQANDDSVDMEKNLKKESAYLLMDELNQKYSALFESSKEISNIASPKSPARVTKPMNECSPTPHLLKPSQMNFNSTYSDNLFRHTTTATSAQSSESIGANQARTKEKQPDFATRFSNVQSQPDFSTKFSDIVSPQTAASSTDFSPTLTRFLYLGQSADKNTANISSQKKSMTEKTALRGIDTNADAFPQSEQVFSPLNAQMLSDMIGFTSSFSEAIVSPRKVSPTMLSRTVMPGKAAIADDSWMSKKTVMSMSGATEEDSSAVKEQDLFTDFASFTPSNFSYGAEESGSQSTKGGVMDKVKFFDSPVTITSEKNKFSSCQGTIMGVHNTLNIKKDAAGENQFDDFDRKWAICTVEPSNEDADKSDKDLGKELNNILAIEDSQPVSVSNDGMQEDVCSNSNNVFFGRRFNEESGTIDSIKNSIGSPGTQLEETLSTIDEADEDLAAQTKLFKESLTPELSEFYSQINLMFDRKVNKLEKRVKSATVENSAIKEEMCHQHQQIQGLMVQLESSRDMMQANQGLMQEIEELRAQLQDAQRKKGKIRFMTSKKFNKKTLKNIWL